MTEAPIKTARLRLLPGSASRRAGGPSPIVPPNSIAGTALMAVVAIMSFLACLTVGAVSLVQGAAADWQSDILREVTIQVLPLEGVDVAAATAAATDIALRTPGVAGARALTDAENAALLEPWLGLGLDTTELPIPRLIVVEIADAALVDLSALATAISGVNGATLDDHRMWTERLRSMANVSVVVGFGVLFLVFAATIMSVVFATRGAMAGNQQIVTVLNIIGAEDWFVAREFQRHFLVLGLKGGLGGAFGAAVLFAILSFAMGAIGDSPEGVQVSALFGSFAVGPGGYFGALLVAFVIAVITAVTSRITVFRYLRDVR